MKSKVTFIALTIVLLCPQDLFNQVNLNREKNDYLPLSVWYSGGKARAPMLSEITPRSREEWLSDLKQIKSLGFTTVRTWVDWQHCEAKEGEYNFKNLELLLDLAQKLDLKVIIQVYTGSDGFGFAPDWVHKKYPDGFVKKENVYQISSPPSNIFCSDHMGIRTAILNFYTETAKIASSYSNFFGWDLWSEPRSARFVCQATRERYRQWLAKKYVTINELNRVWYETYEDWEDIQPQRSGGIGTYAMDADWGFFLCEKAAEDLKMFADAVRKADKKGVITSHASPPSLFGGQLDDFLMAGSVDYYGVSVYPKYLTANTWRSVIIGPDFSYSANKKNGGFYVGEFQGGFSTNSMRVGLPVTPDDHRTWVWSLVAKGAKGINTYAYYVMSSGRESGGFGLIGLDGIITDRAKKLGETARIIHSNNALFAESLPVKAEIALVYNPLTRIVSSRNMEAGGGFANSLIGYYQTFAENNIPVEYIHIKDLESGDLSQYKLVIVPYPIMFTAKAANGLKNYVEKGGCVVSESRLAWNNEIGHTSETIPGLGLSEVFGIKETKVITEDEVVIKIIDNTHLSLSGFNRNEYLRGFHFAESIEPLDGRETQILAAFKDGTPGMIASRYGGGKTIYLGTFLGLSTFNSSDSNNKNFILNLVDWAQVERPFVSSLDGNTESHVEVRLQNNDNGYLLFVINHSNNNENISVSLKTKKNGMHSVRDLILNQEFQGIAKNNIMQLTSFLNAKQVYVWDIRAER